MPMWLVVPLNDCHTFVLFTVFSFCTNAGKRREEGRIHTRLVIFFSFYEFSSLEKMQILSQLKNSSATIR